MSTPPPEQRRVSPDELFNAPDGQRPRFGTRGLLPSLAVNALAPFIAYQILTDRGFSIAAALTISAAFPALGTLAGFVRTRRPDLIGLISLVFIVIGIVTSLISGDARFILIKESLLTGVFGLVCLLSLWVMPRPLLFYFGRQFVGSGDAARAAAYDGLWQYERFRQVQRTMTTVWGIGLIAEALLRVALTFVLPIPLFLIVSPLLAYAVIIGLIAWTMAYARRTSRRARQLTPTATS